MLARGSTLVCYFYFFFFFFHCCCCIFHSSHMNKTQFPGQDVREPNQIPVNLLTVTTNHLRLSSTRIYRHQRHSNFQHNPPSPFSGENDKCLSNPIFFLGWPQIKKFSVIYRMDNQTHQTTKKKRWGNGWKIEFNTFTNQKVDSTGAHHIWYIHIYGSSICAPNRNVQFGKGEREVQIYNNKKRGDTFSYFIICFLLLLLLLCCLNSGSGRLRPCELCVCCGRPNDWHISTDNLKWKKKKNQAKHVSCGAATDVNL